MRKITEKEKKLIEKLNGFKKESNFIELQSAKLLRDSLSCMAVIWNPESEYFSIYYNTIKKDFKPSFFEIVDFLVFIEELEKNNLIKLISIFSDEQYPKIRRLYNKNEFTYDEVSDKFLGTSKKEYELAQTKQNISIDVVGLLEKYATKIIYPLPLLENYIQNDCKTIEEQNIERQLLHARQLHEDQMKQMTKAHEDQMCRTNWSIAIAAIAVISSSVISFITQNQSDKSSMEQIKRIEDAILNNKTELPTTIELSITDTLNVKQVNLRNAKSK